MQPHNNSQRGAMLIIPNKLQQELINSFNNKITISANACGAGTTVGLLLKALKLCCHGENISFFSSNSFYTIKQIFNILNKDKSFRFSNKSQILTHKNNNGKIKFIDTTHVEGSVYNQHIIIDCNINLFTTKQLTLLMERNNSSLEYKFKSLTLATLAYNYKDLLLRCNLNEKEVHTITGYSTNEFLPESYHKTLLTLPEKERHQLLTNQI